MQDLIRDTLAYLKDPLMPKQTLLGTAEEYAFFQVKVEPKTESVATKWVPPVQKKEEKPAAQSPPPAPVAVEKPAPPPAPAPTSTMKQLLQKVAPAIKLTDHVPDDAEAKRIASAWKAEVVLLACDSDAETLEFLKGLAKAIDQRLAKAKILKAEKLSLEKNPYKLIIASAGVEKFSELMQLHKSHPFVILSPAQAYQDADKKASLWKTLCQILQKSS